MPLATRGIGLALADQLQAKGNTVIVGGRRTELLDRIAAERPGLDTVHLDTTDPNSVQVSARLILDKHPDVNVLVTMAGITKIEDWYRPGSFVAQAESMIATNVIGRFGCSWPTRQSKSSNWLPDAQHSAPGLEASDTAMPLDEFVTEVVSPHGTQPGAKTIEVENVKFLRYAEAHGDYELVVAALNGMTVHSLPI